MDSMPPERCALSANAYHVFVTLRPPPPRPRPRPLCCAPKVSVSPTAPKRNEPVSMVAKGTLTKPLTEGKYHLEVKLGSSVVFQHEGSLCGESTAKVTFIHSWSMFRFWAWLMFRFGAPLLFLVFVCIGLRTNGPGGRHGCLCFHGSVRAGFCWRRSFVWTHLPSKLAGVEPTTAQLSAPLKT